MAIELRGRITFQADGVWLGAEDEQPFSTTDRGVRFEFAPSAEPDDYSTEVTATGVFIPPDEVGAVLASRWPELVEEVRAFWAASDAHMGPTGGTAFRWFVFHPEPDVKAFLANARRDLRTSVRRLRGLLSWYFNVPVLSEPLRTQDPRGSIEWSLDGDEWIRDVGGEASPYIAEGEVGLFGVELVGAQDLVEQLLHRYEREPLAYELLSEAVRLRNESPRSALVVAITAAEVAVRTFVAARGREDAAWLLSRPQAPPLDDLLKNYLPFVTETKTRKGAVIPTELRKLVKRGIEWRNKVVHYGEPGPDDEELARLLSAVNDLLFILNWLGGVGWAIQYVSREWRDEYGTEGQAH